jgi:D-3-phosphoglycerate dehydrogenase
MRLVAYDPYVAVDRARQMGIELMSLEELVRAADFITLHVAKTPETVGLVNAKLLADAKPTLRIVNVARGGIVDEEALAEAIREGRIAGAALDVFAEEPTTSSPLFELDPVVITPHLGASTTEAQDKAGVTIAEQVILALSGDFVPYAVNVAAAEASETVRPFLPLAERLGAAFACLQEGIPSTIDITYEGAIADYDTRILTLSVLKGLFSAHVDEPVSYVNAPQLAEERGLEVRESKTSTAHDYVNLISLRGGGNAIAGTLSGVRAEPRIVMVDDHDVDVPFARHLLFVRNDDRPGMVGVVGSVLGEGGINIDQMALGRTAGQAATALMALTLGQPLPSDARRRLDDTPGILDVRGVDLG